MAGTDDNHPLVCAECGRRPRDGENPADEWRAYLDVDDDLPVFCPARSGSPSSTPTRSRASSQRARRVFLFGEITHFVADAASCESYARSGGVDSRAPDPEMTVAQLRRMLSADEREGHRNPGCRRISSRFSSPGWKGPAA